MIIKTLHIDEGHWSTDWIPISYKNILDDIQMEKSYTFLWSNKFNINAIARAYFISKTHIEIGDIWLNENCRGKFLNGEKISVLFMKRVISKIWKKNPNARKISLIVSSQNIPAIKLYKKLYFKVTQKECKKSQLGINEVAALWQARDNQQQVSHVLSVGLLHKLRETIEGPCGRAGNLVKNGLYMVRHKR